MSRTKSDLELFHSHDISIEDKTIYIGAGIDFEIDHKVAEKVVKNLLFLDKKLHVDGITIKMNNSGGECYHGYAIYDAILQCQNHVKCIVYGTCMSMATVILQAADERILSPNSRIMIHSVSGSISGNYYEMINELKEIEYLQNKMIDIYFSKIKENKPRFQKAKLIDLLKKDTYLSPEETLELGLCDKILVYQ